MADKYTLNDRKLVLNRCALLEYHVLSYLLLLLPDETELIPPTDLPVI